ncbi:MAG: DUF4349 domain-containing protein [Candidatus Aenigmatarchaeota archaeon]
MKELEDIGSWVRENKAATAVIVVVVLLITGGIYSIFQASFSYMGAVPDMAQESLEGGRAPAGDTGTSGSGEYVEVKEADVDIESENVEQDSESITESADLHGGYVEESRKETTSLYRRIHLTVRVPRDNFTDYVDRLKENYDLNSYNVRNYRIGIQRELDELQILNKTFHEYEEYREEAKEKELSEEKLDLLMEITEKELRVRERMKSYERQLGEKQKMAEYSTVRVTLEERRVVDITPGNIGNRFKQQVKEMLDNVVATLIGTVTGAVELFFGVIKLIVYLIVIAVPLALAYKLGKRVYEKFQ